MRVISGLHKGRRINPPKGLPVRPTTDQAKEGLFNILSNRIDLNGISVLDLCAGTGNMSYEFISRGAEKLVAVDQHAGCIQFIKQVFKDLEYENGKAIRMSAEKYIKNCEEQFDLIFADPHYEESGKQKWIELIFERKLLKEESLLIFEHRNRERFDQLNYFLETRCYGDSCFSLFEYKEHE